MGAVPTRVFLSGVIGVENKICMFETYVQTLSAYGVKAEDKLQVCVKMFNANEIAMTLQGECSSM